MTIANAVEKSAGHNGSRIRWTWRFFGATLGLMSDADLRFVSSEGRNYVHGRQAEHRVRARALG
jgi:hypothetical protein